MIFARPFDTGWEKISKCLIFFVNFFRTVTCAKVVRSLYILHNVIFIIPIRNVRKTDMINSAMFSTLLKVDTNSMAVKKHRGVLPLMHSEGRNFSLRDVLLCMIAQGFSDSPNGLATTDERAATIARSIDHLLSSRLNIIADHGKHYNELNRDQLIYAGRISLPFPIGVQYVVGTLEEIYPKDGYRSDFVNLQLVNVSRASATLCARCQNEDVNFEELLA